MSGEYELGLELLKNLHMWGLSGDKLPNDQLKVFVHDIDALRSSSIIVHDSPSSLDDLYISELARTLDHHKVVVLNSLKGGAKNIDDLLSIICLNESDFKKLETWLSKAKDVYRKTSENGTRFSNPIEKKDIDDVVLTKSNVYEKSLFCFNELKKSFSDKIWSSHFNFINLNLPSNNAPSNNDLIKFDASPSYDFDSNTVNIPVANVLSFVKSSSSWEFDIFKFINYFSFEYGHGLMEEMSKKSSDLPDFLRVDPLSKGDMYSMSLKESIAHFYSIVMFEKISSDETLQESFFPAESDSDNFAKGHSNFRIMDLYPRRLMSYALMLKSSFADDYSSEKKLDMLGDFAFSSEIANNYANIEIFNKDGVPTEHINVLPYVSDPVSEVIRDLKQKGINYKDNEKTFDKLFLEGFWSVPGFKQKVDYFINTEFNKNQ